MRVNKRFDSMAMGLVLGLVFPWITLVIIWAVKYHGPFLDFLKDFHRINMLSKVVSLSVLPNLLLFFIFIWTSRNFSARGVIFATIIMALVMLMLKIA